MSLGILDDTVFSLAVTPHDVLTLSGVNTPVSGLSVIGPAGSVLTATVTVQAGALYADPAPGATVSGGGSHSLWIAGTVAQINAKLATIVYGMSGVGADRLTLTLTDANGRSAGSSQTSLIVAPATGFATASPVPLVIASGTLSLDSRMLGGLTIDVAPASTSTVSPALVLVSTTLGADTVLEIGDATGNPVVAPRLAIAGLVEFDGLAHFTDGPTTVSLAINSVLTNQGQIRFDDSLALVTGLGTLRNVGLINIAGGSPTLATAILGAGTIALDGVASVTISGSVGSDQTIRFGATAETLILTKPAGMAASIAGFAAGDQIVLSGTIADAITYQAIDPDHGLLTVYNGASTVASIHFTGAYSDGDFRIDQASDRPVGTVQIGLITPPTSASPAIAASVDVYRFFDTTLGTELLTPDAGERDAIAAGRPDLVYEGLAMRALGPDAAGGPNVAAVYRFFDTVHGTHFFTASTAERNMLIGSRSDLVSEPGSTIYEHATQSAGDVPVYRFFDAGLGTHFYTSVASERATILASRPDMVSEGIAFYAPTR